MIHAGGFQSLHEAAAARKARRAAIVFLDAETRQPYHRAPMSAGLPERVDAWRMVAQRRIFSGVAPLAQMTRLRDLLADTVGDARYEIEFGTDEFSVPFAAVTVSAGLTLTCQRSFDAFVLPVRVDSRLGLIREEREEQALPPGYEALLVPADGLLAPLDLVEDELLLQVPVAPLSPGGPEEGEVLWSSGEAVEDDGRENPFAALKDWKKL
jgi:uncharacterized protein